MLPVMTEQREVSGQIAVDPLFVPERRAAMQRLLLRRRHQVIDDVVGDDVLEYVSQCGIGRLLQGDRAPIEIVQNFA